MGETIEIPVLIVGGAGCGLSCAMFLGRLGVQSLVVERHPATSPAPKAHYLNQRTMELFREEGLADHVYANSTPGENMGRVGWYTTLGGDGELDRKRIGIIDAFGFNSLREVYEADSPERAANYALMYVEPMLARRLDDYPCVELRYNSEMTSVTQDADGVTATVEDRESGESYTVRARYMIVADGGRTVGPALGIAMDGVERLFDMVTCHFAADLSDHIDDDSLMIRWFSNPEKGGSWGSGVMVALGPEKFDRHSEEWLFHFAFQPDDPAQFDEGSVIPRLRELLRLPDLEPRLIRMNNWQVQGVLAREYRRGRIFLAGDAAHRHPPTTGLGLNTAIQDAHNLAWKLAAVLNGTADPALLDSYEAERRPVAANNVAWAMMTFQNHLTIDAAIGQMPGAPVEFNREAFRRMFADTPEGRARRQLVAEVINTQRCEFQAHDIEIGFAYGAGALIPDGSEEPPRGALGDTHTPVMRPGHRLAHCWLEKDGERVSTLDLCGLDHFTVLVNGEAGDWRAAAERIGRAADVEIRVEAIGGGDGWQSPDGRWDAVSGLNPGGALLVRPDQHVGWRGADPVADPAATLAEAMAVMLARPLRIEA